MAHINMVVLPYKLKIKCDNCDKVWEENIPFGLEWQNYGRGLEILHRAGYGTRCKACGKIRCGHSGDFVSIYCRTCGSNYLQKVVKRNYHDCY